jgi:PAS domain S-box-containing protein
MLQRRAKNEPENSARLLAEALSALDNAHAELAAARDELHEHADEMLATRLERELEWTRYRHLFEAAPVSYVETDTCGVVIEANRRSCALLNLPAARLIGKPLAAFVSQVDRLTFRRFLSTLGASLQHASIVLHLKSRNGGAPFTVQAHVSTVDTMLGRAPALRWVMIPHGAPGAMSPDEAADNETPMTEAVLQTAARTRARLARRNRRSLVRSRAAACSRWRDSK